MPATHVIVRPIPGEPFVTGDEVDASGWRRPERFVDRGYLRALVEDSGFAQADEQAAEEAAAIASAEAEMSPVDAPKASKRKRR